MRSLILGTAGHIDHGKTALVKALTGIDTDRLKEEQERGITVDLGFADYRPRPDVSFGVVDVPGHEGFIRNMLAGATGMDLVLLVVAADEGVMPQTREHMAIVQLLSVPGLAVALTKVDLVEPEWIDLVRDDVADLLRGSVYEAAPIVGVSAKTGEGLKELGEVLAGLGEGAEDHRTEDVARLPVDRVFTIRGAGTVVTGTLWTGTLRQGANVRLLPGDRKGRLRSVQVHGHEVDAATAGNRVALAIKGADVSHHDLRRGQTVVDDTGWAASRMLTTRTRLLSDTTWSLEQGQRVRVHLGTAEVLARVALFDRSHLAPGDEGWLQLRLEEPILARVRDHLVIRSYSPVTTIGGGRVAEVFPKKRRRLEKGEEQALLDRLDGSSERALVGLLGMAHLAGIPEESLPQRTGLTPEELSVAVSELLEGGALRRVEDSLVGARAWQNATQLILGRLTEFHRDQPLRAGLVLEELRQTIMGPIGAKLVEAVVQDLVSKSEILLHEGTACLSGFQASLTEEQERVRDDLLARLKEAGLAPPSVRELAETERDPDEVLDVLRYLEARDELVSLDRDFFILSKVLKRAGEAVVEGLGGQAELGPAEFREVLPVSRRHLLPILRYFDLIGVTTRIGDSRSVSRELPPGWGTSFSRRK